MAKRKSDIVIKEYGFDAYAVYCDLPAWKIKNLEGIASINTSFRDEGFIIVRIDPRYDEKEVLSEIKQLT